MTDSRRKLTSAEYLALERASEIKHELVDGEMFAMSGATRRHNLITKNLIVALDTRLRDRPCEVYPPDMRVKSLETGVYTYPDVSVVCGDPTFEDDRHDTLVDPRVVFEVLSETTEGYDRGRKFEHYRSIPSIRDYVLVSQDHALVEHFTRQADGTWVLREVRPGDVVRVEEIELPVDEIYRHIDFDSEQQ